MLWQRDIIRLDYPGQESIEQGTTWRFFAACLISSKTIIQAARRDGMQSSMANGGKNAGRREFRRVCYQVTIPDDRR